MQLRPVEVAYRKHYAKTLARKLGYIEWRLEKGRTDNYTAASWSWQLEPLAKLLIQATCMSRDEFVALYGVTPGRIHVLANEIAKRIKTLGFHPSCAKSWTAYLSALQRAIEKGIPLSATNIAPTGSYSTGAIAARNEDSKDSQQEARRTMDGC